jgi:hypothetical protein
MAKQIAPQSPEAPAGNGNPTTHPWSSGKLSMKGWWLFTPPWRRHRRDETTWFARYFGLVFAALGTLVLAFLTFWDVLVPERTKPDFLKILGLGALAALTASFTMAPAILSVRKQSGESKRLRALRERLRPTLYFGMGEVVNRWAELLLPGVKFKNVGGLDPALELELHVFLKIDGHYRIVASSSEESSNVRRLELMENEGMIHTVYQRNTAVVAVVQSDSSVKLFSANGREIGDQPSLRPKNADKCNPDLKWVYATPIFDSTHPYSDKTLGVFTIDGLNSASDELYFKTEFRRLVESVALQLASYVSAYNSLMESNHAPDDVDSES